RISYFTSARRSFAIAVSLSRSIFSWRLIRSTYCGIPLTSMSTGTMCRTKTVPPFSLAIFAASSSAVSELESKSTGARIRLNGKAMSSPAAQLLERVPEQPEQKRRQHDRSRQRQNPGHRDVADRLELQAGLVGHHRARNSRRQHVGCTYRQAVPVR